MSVEENRLRQQLVQAMKAMDAQGLNHGTAGNVSARLGDEFLVTPSGVAPSDLDASMIVKIDSGGAFQGKYKPTSEWRMHVGVLIRRKDVNAAVHCHSQYATTLACARKTIPPLHYMTAVSGSGEIRLAPYATYGTQELADGILETLDGAYACLMANHGQIAVGPTLDMALMIATEVEVQASFYVGALAIGGPSLLTEKQIKDVFKQFKSYGQ